MKALARDWESSFPKLSVACVSPSTGLWVLRCHHLHHYCTKAVRWEAEQGWPGSIGLFLCPLQRCFCPLLGDSALRLHQSPSCLSVRLELYLAPLNQGVQCHEWFLQAFLLPWLFSFMVDCRVQKPPLMQIKMQLRSISSLQIGKKELMSQRKDFLSIDI